MGNPDNEPPAYTSASAPPPVQTYYANAQPGVQVQVLSVPGLMGSPDPVSMQCPQCKQQIVTRIAYDSGTLTWLLCFLGLWVSCCCIPFCIDACKDVLHSCPNCNTFLGRYKRM